MKFPISLALSLAIYSGLAGAVPPTTSAYSSDPQYSSVEDPTSEGLSKVNMLTCILAATRPEEMVNRGSYNALIDESKCDTEPSRRHPTPGKAIRCNLAIS